MSLSTRRRRGGRESGHWERGVLAELGVKRSRGGLEAAQCISAHAFEISPHALCWKSCPQFHEWMPQMCCTNVCKKYLSLACLPAGTP